MALAVVAASLVVPLAGPAAPAAAAACTGTQGVTVVVDYNELGGGVQGTCVTGGGGKRASELFAKAGFPLTRVSGEGGFVCRISGKPGASAEPCNDTPPTTAYWGLWWSDGKGNWTYANYGVDALKVPNGSWVGFSWKQGTGSASSPSITPRTAPAPSPTTTPTQQPTQQPTHQPTGQPGNQPGTDPTNQPSAAPSHQPSDDDTAGVPSASPTTDAPRPGRTPSRSPSPTGTAGETSSTPPAATSSTTDASVEQLAEPAQVEESSEAANSDDGGLPGWLAPVVIVLLFLGAGAAVLIRRRGSPQP